MVHMAKTAYINARVESEVKKKAEKVLRDVGVNTSDAVNMFLRQIILQDGIPFEVRKPNKETLRAIKALEAGKGTRYKGATKDIFDSKIYKR